MSINRKNYDALDKFFIFIMLWAQSCALIIDKANLIVNNLNEPYMTIQKTLNTIAAILLLMAALPNFLFSQTVQVAKVLDANLLQLKSGQIVRLSDIYVPSAIDSNKNLRQFSGEIKEFSEKYFVNRYFKMKYNRSLPDSTRLVYLYREYAAGDDEDVATIFLKNGYAACIDSSAMAEQYNYAGYQKEAQDSKLGMWSLVPSDYFKNRDSSANYKADEVKNAGLLPKPENTRGQIQLQNGNFVRQPILKDPTLAGVLSFIVPGAGQIYDEQFIAGMLYMGSMGFCYYKYFSTLHVDDREIEGNVTYLLAGVAIHVLSIVEASIGANDYNKNIYFSLNKVKDNYYVSLRLPL